jgi:hypothetical protein
MLRWFINDQGIVRSGWKVFGFFLLLMALVAVAGLGLHALGRPQVVGPGWALPWVPWQACSA